MRPLVLAALLAGGGAAPSHRSLGDGGWHAAHPGFVSPTTKAPATNAATQSQRPVFDPAKQLRGCAGVDTLNSNFQHNKFQMVVALKPWRFLATIEMRFKSVSAREAAGLNLAKTAGARVLGWLPAARGRPQSLFFQTTTNAINTGLGGNSFRVEGVGTIDTKAVTFHCEGLGFDCGEGCAKVDCGNGATAAYQARRRRYPRPPAPPPPPHLSRRPVAAPQVDSYLGRGFEAHVRVQNWKPGTHVGLQWPGRTIKPVAPRAATVLKTESLGWGSQTIFTLANEPIQGGPKPTWETFNFHTDGMPEGVPILECWAPGKPIVPGHRPPPPPLASPPPPPAPKKAKPPPAPRKRAPSPSSSPAFGDGPQAVPYSGPQGGGGFSSDGGEGGPSPMMIIGAVAAAAGVVLVAFFAFRSCCGGGGGERTVHGGGFDDDELQDDGPLQIIVEAFDHEAELEIQPDAFDSFEGLRELVVDAVPQMFGDTDSIVLDYMGSGGRWQRVKTRTSLATVKASGSIKITVQPPAARNANGRRRGFEMLGADDDDDL